MGSRWGRARVAGGLRPMAFAPSDVGVIDFGTGTGGCALGAGVADVTAGLEAAEADLTNAEEIAAPIYGALGHEVGVRSRLLELFPRVFTRRGTSTSCAVVAEDLAPHSRAT
eukprot:551076-Pyramimonas_sp.AAC.1